MSQRLIVNCGNVEAKYLLVRSDRYSYVGLHSSSEDWVFFARSPPSELRNALLFRGETEDIKIKNAIVASSPTLLCHFLSNRFLSLEFAVL